MESDRAKEGVVWVEIQPGPPDLVALKRLPAGASAVSNLSSGPMEQLPIEKVRATVSSIAEAFANAFAEGGPEAWTVEFGIGFKGSAGVPVLVSGEASANLKVVMSWRRS